MGNIPAYFKEVEPNRFMFDIRYRDVRVRPKVNGTIDYVKLIKFCIEMIDNDYILLNIDNKFIQDEFMSKIYETHCQNYSIKHDKNDTLYQAMQEAIRVIKTLAEKIKQSDVKPVKTFVDGVNQKNETVIKAILLGEYGTGKTELIKQFSSFNRALKFPVTDSSRTTTYPCHYIFKNLSNNNGFAFVAEFKQSDEIENNILESYNRAIYKALQCFRERRNKAEMQDIVIKEFIADPLKLFKIDYIIGKYYEQKNEKRFLKENQSALKQWANIFEGIYTAAYNFIADNCPTQTESGFTDIELGKNDLDERILKDKNQKSEIKKLAEQTAVILEEQLSAVCEDLQKKGFGETITENGKIIGFKNDNYDLKNIEEILTSFVSTNIEDFTKIVTPLVKEMAVEIPYNDTLSNQIKDGVLLITDTTGLQHRKTLDYGSIEGSTANLYNQYDFIGLLEVSKNSINETTENVIKELYLNAHKDKIIMLYSFYDEFGKKDFADDADKQDYLLDLQTAAIKKIDPTPKSDNFVNTLKQNTIFLKGLMSHDGTECTDCINLCLSHIKNKFNSLYKYKDLRMIDIEKPLITYNYKRLALVFQQVQFSYVKQQYDLYMKKIPYKKMTEALTFRLLIGQTYFSGTFQTLKPVDDLVHALMEKIEIFIKNPKEINFELSESILRHEEKVLDWFKEEISCKLKVFIKNNFVDAHSKDWELLYNFSGIDADLQRRNGLMQGINEFLPSLDIEKPHFADRWIEEIENIFVGILCDMKKSIVNQ